MEPFVKSDRLMENELVNLECYNEFWVERTLNSMDDKVLNDHLHKNFYSKKPDTTALMCQWIGYYVKQHKSQIHLKVKDYLESKKLTLDDWLRCVGEGCRGDILCVYVLSIATGVHTMVHLKNNKIWSTLQNRPTTHEEMVNRCEKHLVYLGFGIFLHLLKRDITTTMTIPVVIETISSEDPRTTRELIGQAREHTQLRYSLTGTTQTPQKKMASAAAGSAAQLNQDETIVKQEQTCGVDNSGSQIEGGMVSILLFEVQLK